MLDLWPTDITQSRMRAPVTILKQQALLLEEKTEGIIIAKVKRLDRESNNGINRNPDHLFKEDQSKRQMFMYEFYLIAPTLDNYYHSLFQISHSIELYPISIYSDEELRSEYAENKHEGFIVNSETEFIETLRKIFGSRKTKKIIHAIIAQSAELDLN